jgi:hypothetical protein
VTLKFVFDELDYSPKTLREYYYTHTLKGQGLCLHYSISDECQLYKLNVEIHDFCSNVIKKELFIQEKLCSFSTIIIIFFLLYIESCHDDLIHSNSNTKNNILKGLLIKRSSII